MRQLNPIAGEPDEEMILLDDSGIEVITEEQFWRELFPFLPRVLPTEEMNRLLDQCVETSEPVIVDDPGGPK